MEEELVKSRFFSQKLEFLFNEFFAKGPPSSSPLNIALQHCVGCNTRYRICRKKLPKWNTRD